jgi:hypothetical protein
MRNAKSRTSALSKQVDVLAAKLVSDLLELRAARLRLGVRRKDSKANNRRAASLDATPRRWMLRVW